MPQNTNPIPYRPAFFIGLGGTGKEVLLRLRRRFYERFRTVDVPFARFLWIDTDTRAVDARGEKLDELFSAVTFGPSEQFALLRDNVGADMSSIFANPEKWRFIHQWLYEEVERFGRGIKDGAGGVRAIGRLTFFSAYNSLHQAIDKKFRELSQHGTIAETQKFFEDKGLPPVNASGGVDPVVFVITSVAGGTGCGTFLDTGFLACDIYSRLKGSASAHGDIFAYVFLPTVYYDNPRSDDLARRSFGNAYAALKELDHYTKRISVPSVQGQKEDSLSVNFNVQWEPNRSKSIQGPPFNAVYLMEMANEGGLAIDLPHRRDLFSMLAECLFLDLLPGSFADAKRSDYSNIVTKLAGAEGANSLYDGVNLTQMFSRRYAACGLSKIEVPVDSVRGACGAALSVAILGYILRDSEDALVAKSVRDDLAAQRLDADGIPSLYSDGWKDQVHTEVAEFFRSRQFAKHSDIDAFKADLEKLSRKLLGDISKPGDVVKWLRLRTGGVAEDVRQRAGAMLRNQCLENPDRGLNATIRKGGYLDIAREQVHGLHSPAKEGTAAVFDQRRAAAENDGKALADLRARYLNELDSALDSIPILILQVRDITVRTLVNRLRDAVEQELLAKTEAALFGEAQKVGVELETSLQQWHATLGDLAAKFAVVYADSHKVQKEFAESVQVDSHLLFTRYFQMEEDWPIFYKLGIDRDSGRPAEIDPGAEYNNLLRAWNVANGILDLAALFIQDSTEQLGQKLRVYCEDIFDKDFRKNPRPVSLLDRPVFKDPSQRRQALQNLVNRARPMLRQDSVMGNTVLQSPRFAYLGMYTHNPRTPEENAVIDEITKLIGSIVGIQYTLDVHPLDRPHEMYLYFSNYAFAAPSLPTVTSDCHDAYTDFYTEMMKSPVGTPQASIPLHLSKAWEGRFDDLEVFSDLQSKLLVEVLSILLFGSMLRVLHPVLEKEQIVIYKYKLGAPINRLDAIGNRRHVISRLMREDELRAGFLGAIAQREGALTKEQSIAYFWAVTACLADPEMMPAMPEYALLTRKLNTIYKLAVEKGADSEKDVNSALLPETDRFGLIKTGGTYNLEWPTPSQPVLKSGIIADWAKTI